ncbi:MAG TPA: muconolactone Delta-isomerase family protein [Polyangiaceae bacterium]|nr:muconolactone Delta-isomerase family protein [Polyangiaceae bacterium]
MSVVINTPASQIGRALATYLLDLGEPLTLISRSPDKVRPFVERGARLVEGNIDDPAVLDRAFEGATGVFWLTPPALRPDFHDWAVAAAERAAGAAARRGLARAVVLSSVGAHHGPGTGPVGSLLAVERAFEAALPDVTSLRPGFFMENIFRDLPAIAAKGAVFSPVPAAKRFPWVATRDIGLRAGQLFADRSWRGHRALGVHGPADLSWDEVAATLGRELGRPLRYVEVSVDEARKGLAASGAPPFVVDLYAEMFEAIRAGKLDPAEPRTDATTTATTLAEFARTVLAPALAVARHGSRRFLASLVTRPEATSEQIAAVLPDEHRRFGELSRDGVVAGLNLAVDRRRGWLVVRAQDAAAAEAAVKSLPLSRFWDVEIAELAPEV